LKRGKWISEFDHLPPEVREETLAFHLLRRERAEKELEQAREHAIKNQVPLTFMDIKAILDE
jgi:hypothetical protein